MVAFMNLIGKKKSSGSRFWVVSRVILRFLQFVLAITVAGIYAVDLSHAAKAGVYADAKWVYAVSIGGLSALTVCMYGLCWFIRSEMLFWWDWILFVLWIVVFGIFGRIYIPARPTPEQDDQIRMQHAVWVDLINMIFWAATASYGTWMFFRERSKRGLPNKGDA